MTELAVSTGPRSATATLVSPADTRWLLLGLALATGMEFYTFDSVNLVLADMTGTLGLSADEASWLLTVYSCSLFIGVPVSIWLAGHVGYKRFLLATTILFAIASMGCAASSSLQTLLIWRAIQGLAGAGLLNWWRASVYLLMPKPQRSPSLMRISTVLYLSSAAGLLLSGYLTDRFNWRLIFLPNLLYAAGAVCLLLRYYPTVAPPAPLAGREDRLAGYRAARRGAHFAADRAQPRSDRQLVRVAPHPQFDVFEHRHPGSVPVVAIQPAQSGATS